MLASKRAVIDDKIKWEFGLGERALAAGEESGASKITIPVVDSGTKAGKKWIGMPYHPKGCRNRKGSQRLSTLSIWY